MRTFFICMVIGLSVSLNVTAQGGGRRGGGGGGGAREGFQSQPVSRDYSQIQIAEFPEISGLEVKKKLKLFSIVKDEQKNILTLMDEKRGLQASIDRARNEKDANNNRKKMEKVDDKIQKTSSKADKQIRSILTTDQYDKFIKEKSQIKFDIPSNRGPRANFDR